MIDIAYDLDALRKNVARCDVNIKTFEDAIQAEEESKRNLWHMIRTLEEDQANGNQK